MKPKHIPGVLMALVLLVFLATRATSTKQSSANFIEENAVAKAQVPTWSEQDMDFFLHGSMSTEVVPETVLRAFIKTYPDLFPTADLTHLGMIPDADFGWPIGFSRANVKHLGGLSAIGINCASCHVAQITSTTDNKPIRILGTTSHFNVEAFFGSVLVATFKTSDPANMKSFLAAICQADPKMLETTWSAQSEKIAAAMKADPFGAKEIAPGELHQIDNKDLQTVNRDRTSISRRARIRC